MSDYLFGIIFGVLVTFTVFAVSFSFILRNSKPLVCRDCGLADFDCLCDFPETIIRATD